MKVQRNTIRVYWRDGSHPFPGRLVYIETSTHLVPTTNKDRHALKAATSNDRQQIIDYFDEERDRAKRSRFVAKICASINKRNSKTDRRRKRKGAK